MPAIVTMAGRSSRRYSPGGGGGPNPFSFVDQSGAALSTVTTSAGVTITGTGGPWPITVSGCTYDINGSGTFVSSAGSISNNDIVRARVTSSGSYSTAVNGAVTIGAQSDTFTVTTQGAPGAFPLPAGHFMPAKQAMRVIYPRPNGETSTYARHRRAFYNGANPMVYDIPIGVNFGAFPYKYEMIAGPTGMTVGQFYGDTDYGRVKWTPAGTETGTTCTVRVTDQELNTVDVTWTVTTTSSTADFVFISNTGNDSTGTGAITAPYATISKVFGTVSLATLNPNAIIVMRGGTYVGISQTGTGSGYGIAFKAAATPMALMGFPGETATIGMSGSGAVSQFNTDGADGHDLFFQNFTLTGNPTTTNFRIFFMGQEMDRTTFDKINAPNVYQGSNANDNATTIYYNSCGPTGYRSYIFINECTETNRGMTGGGGNSWSMFCIFTSQYVLAQKCTVTGTQAQWSLYSKASVKDVTLRLNYSDGSVATGCQVDSSLDNINFEYCYNTVKDSLVMNGEYTGAGAKRHWYYRNTVLGNGDVNGDIGSNGPFTWEQNVIQAASGNPLQNAYGNGAPGAATTNTGTECQGSSGIINTSTLLLIGTYRTNYLGLRGAEIA